MKKLYSLFAAVAFSATVCAQTSVTYTFSGNNATEVLSGTVDANISFVTDKGEGAQSPTFYTASPAGVRIYSVRSSGVGNSFIIKPAAGYEITELTFTAQTGYTPTVTYSVNGGASQQMTLSGTTYTVSGISADTSLKFTNAHMGGGTNIQLRIPSFTVTYQQKTLGLNETNAKKAQLVKNSMVTNELRFATKSDIKIITMNGQVVKTASVNEDTVLDVSSLANGVYMVSGSVNGKTVTQKVIKK